METRWQRAKSDTKGFRAWIREIAVAIVTAILVWRFQPRDEIVTEIRNIAFAVGAAVIIVPLVEFAWNWLKAPLRIAKNQISDLTDQVDKLTRERDELRKFDLSQEFLDKIAAYREKETKMRNEEVEEEQKFPSWKKKFQTLRKQIHRAIKLNVSRAEADTFETVGNLRHKWPNGVNDKHILLRSIATRDIDYLEEFIKDYSRLKKR